MTLHVHESPDMPDKKSMQSSLGQRRSAMILTFLAICVTLLMSGFMLIAPVFPQRLQALGLGAQILALMEMAFSLGMVLFSTPMGMVADRFGRKPVIMIALTGFIVTNVLLVLANASLLFIAIRFVEGVCISGLLPTATAMVADLASEKRQGRWLSILAAAQATGVAAGPAIGGLVVETWGFLFPFLLSAAIAALASVLAWFFIPETLSKDVRERAKKQHEQISKRSIWFEAFPQPARFFGILLFIDCSLNFVYPFVLPLYPFYFSRMLMYSPAQYGAILGIYGLALAVFPLLLGRFIDGPASSLLITLGCVLYASLNIGMLFFVQYPLLILAAIVAGVGQALWLPGLGVVYLSRTDEQHRSQVMGLRQTSLALGMLFGSLLQALMAPWIDPRTSFSIAALVPVGAALLVFIVFLNSSWQKQRDKTKVAEMREHRQKCSIE